jgi:hypothetical protein
MVELQTYLDGVAAVPAAKLSDPFERFVSDAKKYAEGHEEKHGGQRQRWLDVLVVEANVDLRDLDGAGGLADYLPLALGGRPASCSLVVELRLGEQRMCTAPAPEDRCPVWNADATFTYNEGPAEPPAVLEVRLRDRSGRVRARGGLLAEAGLAVWRAPLGELLSIEVPLARGAVLHLRMQRLADPLQGVLAHCGAPLRCIPYRMQAGDLVLVNSSALITHGTKIATWSEWDHVAMVVALPGKARLRFFEATMNGVECDCSLESCLLAYLQAAQIAVRRLLFDGAPVRIAELAAFASDVNGRPYKQSPMELVRAWAGRHEVHDASSFFCSQLVAAGLQRMGLLDLAACPTNFMPADFAGDVKGALRGARLAAAAHFGVRGEVRYTTQVAVAVGARSFTIPPRLWHAPPAASAAPQPRAPPSRTLPPPPSSFGSHRRSESGTTLSTPSSSTVSGHGRTHQKKEKKEKREKRDRREKAEAAPLAQLPLHPAISPPATFAGPPEGLLPLVRGPTEAAESGSAAPAGTTAGEAVLSDEPPALCGSPSGSPPRGAPAALAPAMPSPLPPLPTSPLPPPPPRLVLEKPFLSAELPEGAEEVILGPALEPSRA